MLLPLLAAGLARWRRWPAGYAFDLFAGFCLLANGAYVGLGAVDPLGDTERMLRHGTPAWLLAAAGTAAAAMGLWCWHRASPFLKPPLGPPPVRHAQVAVVLATGVVLASACWTLAGR